MAFEIPKSNKLTKEEKDMHKKKYFLTEIKNKGTITEGEILLIKRRLNDGNYTEKEVREALQDSEGYVSYKLTPEQKQKGKEYLIEQYKSPKGVERKNNPFGYREMNALDNFEDISFEGFYDNSNAYTKNYVPLYYVKGSDGSSFEYYIDYKGVNIVG
jgi:hypothetical protein